MTISVTTLGHAKVAILAIMARLEMATDMVVIGVYAKIRKNADNP